jgi:hypothetical protein
MIKLAVVLLISGALAQEAPRYPSPRPTQDPKENIIGGILLAINGLILQDANRRGAQCTTFIEGLSADGFPMFKRVCRAAGQ